MPQRRKAEDGGRGAPGPEELGEMIDKAFPLDNQQEPTEVLPMSAVGAAFTLGPELDSYGRANGPEALERAAELAGTFLPPLLQQALVAQRIFPQLQLVDLLVIAVMRNVGPVPKGETYEQGNTRYNFRGIDATVNATAAAIRDAGLYVRPIEVERSLRDALTTAQKPTREVTTVVTYRIQAPDGSHRDVKVPGEALDQADKGSAKAMSVALRILLLQVLMLPTTEPDPDAQYLTREGYAGLSPSSSTMLRQMIATAPLLAVFVDAVAVIREHAAWERHSVPGDDASPLWGAVLAARVAGDIAALPGVDSARAMAAAIKSGDAGGWRHDGETLVNVLRARWAELVEVGRKTHEHCMQLVLDSLGLDELARAIEHIEADTEHGALPAKEAGELLALAYERSAKLPEFAPEPEEAPCDESAVHEPHVDSIRDQAGQPHRFRCPGVTEGQLAERLERERQADALGAETGTPEEEPPWSPTEAEQQWAAFQARVAAASEVGAELDPAGRSGAVTDALAALLHGEARPIATDFGVEGVVAVDDAVKAAHRRDGLIVDDARAYLNGLLTTAYGQITSAWETPALDDPPAEPEF